MSLINVIRNATAAVAGSLLLASTPVFAVAAPPAPFSALYVFGDSLSDNGNLFALTGGFPPAPYFQGRFSNGPVAVEVLAGGLGLAAGQFHDKAIAGAMTGTGGQFPSSGMLNQVAGFQASLQGAQADGGALYFVWGGANDLRGGVSIGEAIGNLSNIVSTLHGLGARKFLLPNLPDLGLTPEAREGGGAAQASFASVVFNQQLAAAYGALATQWSDEQFFYFDAFGAQHAITDGSASNGFNNVSNRCFDSRVPSLCATPSAYLYWDNIHPTAAAHQILGNQMLAAVPEPQAMLMMAVGLLGLLAATRRRQA